MNYSQTMYCPLTSSGGLQIGTLLDVKANIEDVNAALLEVSNELDRKAALEALDALRQEQVGRRHPPCSSATPRPAACR